MRRRRPDGMTQRLVANNREVYYIYEIIFKTGESSK